MAPRRRRKSASRGTPNLGLIAFQVIVLVGLLIALISFRDHIGAGAGAMMDSLATEDIAVERQRHDDGEAVEESPGAEVDTEHSDDEPGEAEISEEESENVD